MLTLDIPGRGALNVERVVLDVNGTIAEDGHLIPGVKDRLARLRRTLEVILLTADTHGRQAAIDSELEMEALRLQPGTPEDGQKAAAIARLGAGSTDAIGNGTNDALMLQAAALGVAVIGPEGASVAALT